MAVTTEIFLADTYALIEILNGNINYKPYIHHYLFTTKLNLIELYYHHILEFDKETADRYLTLYKKFLIPVSFTSIQAGMHFRLKNKKENLSYTDCIGYALALELSIPFLTGDQKFKNKENVEFIK